MYHCTQIREKWQVQILAGFVETKQVGFLTIAVKILKKGRDCEKIILSVSAKISMFEYLKEILSGQRFLKTGIADCNRGGRKAELFLEDFKFRSNCMGGRWKRDAGWKN